VRSPRRVALGAALIGLLAAGCGAQPTPSGQAAATPAPTTAPAPAGSTPAECDFTTTPDQPAPSGHDVGVPPKSAPRSGTVTVTLHTSQGDIPITMPRAKAPCTVASFAYLAGKGYFDHTPCHRLTAASSLKVLQCGDPTGTGTGGPGYTIPDENPTDLPPAPDGQGADLYARGTVAMANTNQPHSGGSQFFLVYANSELPPSYAVFGQVQPPGLTTLDRIAAAGIQGGGEDGTPTHQVTITKATLAG
jgi:peptidyl-prolyl cis-trans isomerase B (cyclophilin B)